MFVRSWLNQLLQGEKNDILILIFKLFLSYKHKIFEQEFTSHAEWGQSIVNN